MALIDSAPSSAELQVPGSFAATVGPRCWPRMTAGEWSQVLEPASCGIGVGGHCGALSWPREPGAESWQESYGSLKVLSHGGPDLQAEGTTVGAGYYLLSSYWWLWQPSPSLPPALEWKEVGINYSDVSAERHRDRIVSQQ